VKTQLIKLLRPRWISHDQLKKVWLPNTIFSYFYYHRKWKRKKKWRRSCKTV